MIYKTYLFSSDPPPPQWKGKKNSWFSISYIFEELIVTSPYFDSSTFTMGNPMPESTLSPSQRLSEFGLCIFATVLLYYGSFSRTMVTCKSAFKGPSLHICMVQCMANHNGRMHGLMPWSTYSKRRPRLLLSFKFPLPPYPQTQRKRLPSFLLS